MTERWWVTVISRGARSPKVKTIPLGCCATGFIAHSDGQLLLAPAIDLSREVDFFCGILSTTKGTAAPRPARTTRLVPNTRTKVFFERKARGASVQTNATAPGMASICAA